MRIKKPASSSGSLPLVAAGLGSKYERSPAPTIRAGNHPSRYLYLGRELGEPRSHLEVEWLQRRKQAQEARARQHEVVHNFKFADQLQRVESLFEIQLWMTPRSSTEPFITTTATE